MIYRLQKGGDIHRDQRLNFQFDGKAYEGYLGDTLASALLANGVKVVARSFKYHRPRGVFTAGSEEPNALVQLEEGAHTVPNCAATEIELYEGLIAHSQNCWPSVNFDVGAINNVLSRFLPSGFYYKTFMWPKALWMRYEKAIRHSAGLGRAPTEKDPNCYDHQHVFYDVVVVGGGAAGISAAISAGLTGCSVLLINEPAEWGGALLGEQQSMNGKPARQWVDKCIVALGKLPNVTLRSRTTVTGYYAHNYLIANQRISHHLGSQAPKEVPRERLWKIRAAKVVLATGSIERPLVFADNDRPGVMLAGAVRAYIHRYGVLPGGKIVVISNNDSVYPLAAEASELGAKVVVVDSRAEIPTACLDMAGQHGFRVEAESSITAVQYTNQLRSVSIGKLTADGCGIEFPSHQIEADLIANSGGWIPTLHLYSQAGGKLKYAQTQHCFLPDQQQVLKPDALLAGSCTGSFDLVDCLSEGYLSGLKAANGCGFDSPGGSLTLNNVGSQFLCESMRPLWVMPGEHPIGRGPSHHFHELHNDVTVADIELAEREGYISVEHLKRYTTTGMGTDQGKTSNVNALSVMAGLRKKPMNEVGTTTFRPPFTPLTFGAIVGQNRQELFLQERRSPMDSWHQKQGAQYEDVGDWKRPRYFPQGEETLYEAVQRECKTCRDSVGILDATTLGKIDIQGEDAAKLLNMVYTNAWSQLGIGRCRYGLMLNEHGMVFDDGVTTRLGKNHFHMTTTTGGAGRVMAWLEELLQTEWPEWQVYCTSVTEQWAVMAVNGPQARALLSELTDVDLSNEAFPFMSMIEAKVAGVQARIFRISFTGELAFEINVPARFGLHVWEAIMDAGKAYRLTPYGTEAMHVLRAEKGFIIVGQDSDGSATPYDLDMSWIVSKKKNDFIGKRSLSRSDTAKSGRKQLIGLRTEDPDFVLPEGAHIVEEVKPAPPMKMLGHVTSSYFSPNVQRSIAMAMLKDGFNRVGESVSVALMDGSSHKAIICKPIFFDEPGERSRG